MERSGDFRGGRGGGRGVGRGRGRGRGGRTARGRGGGRGGGRRGGFGSHPQRHEEQGYVPGYAPSYPLPPPPPPNEAMYHMQRHSEYLPPRQELLREPGPFGEQEFPSPLAPQPTRELYPRPHEQYPQQQQQMTPPQRPHGHYPQQGYTADSRVEDTSYDPRGFKQVIDPFQTQPGYHQQYPRPPHLLHRQQQHLPPGPFQEPQGSEYPQENRHHAGNMQLTQPSAAPFFPPPSDYVDAARARQASFRPLSPGRNVSHTTQSPYQEPQQPPPPMYEQRRPPMPQDPRGGWNHPPQEHLQWQYAPHEQQQQQQQQQFVGGPPGYVQQQQGPPPMDPHRFPRDHNPPFQDRWQDKQDRQHHKQHRIPPPTYVCHNCNQPGHWKQHCPLFANENDRYGSGPPIEQRFGVGSGPDQQLAPVHSTKPQDPRKNGGSHISVSSRGKEEPCGAAKDESRGQPPLPNGPAPPLPPSLQSHGMCASSTQLQSQPSQQSWKCEPCIKNFAIASQYDAHVKTHVTCSACDFSACQRVVTAHYETSHGQYSGEGLKEIVVEGQKFMVLVGNSAEDIAKWREERRKRWFAMSRHPTPALATVPLTGKRKLSITSEEDLEDGEIEEEEEAKARVVLASSAASRAASDAAASHRAKSDVQEPPVKKQRKSVLCKWFLRDRCRFNEANCKYSHDRSTFGCRFMMSKGSCSKGARCLFSHDTTVLSGQRERSVKASKEHATEQQWRDEKKSLLRKLLAKDVRLEQQKMLQIVHFLVESKFLGPLEGEEDVASAVEPVVKTDMNNSGEASSSVDAEASESFQSTSGGAVKEEASDDVTFDPVSSTEECDSAAPFQAVEPTKVVADAGVVPVVEGSACEDGIPSPSSA